MRFLLLLLVLSGAGLAAWAPNPARAQATVDPRALDPLQAAPGTAKPAPPEPTKPEAVHPTTPQRAAPQHPAPQHPAPQRTPPRTTTPPHPATPAPLPAPPQVRVPLAAPTAPVLPAPLLVPARPVAPPAPTPVAADAPGIAAAVPDGLRITFGEGRSDLNPATDSALRTLAHGGPPDAAFTVSAFAPGAPEDPSTPRRLSLSRALTVRAVLIAEGIPSVRIYVKALGAGRGVADGPADRVDVTVAATNPQARSP